MNAGGRMSIATLFRDLFGSRPPPEPLLLAAGPEESGTSEEDEAGAETVDFVAVLEAAGINADQRATVGRAQELLKSLPTDAPEAVNRKVVEAAFTAFDVPILKITKAASGTIKALTAQIDRDEAATQQLVMRKHAEMETLEAAIERARAAISLAVERQEARTQATNEEILRVKPVLKFFVAEVLAQTIVEEPEEEPAADPAAPAAE